MSAVSHRARAVRGLAPLVAIALFRQRLILLAIRALRCLKRRQERRPVSSSRIKRIGATGSDLRTYRRWNMLFPLSFQDSSLHGWLL
eukprot:scaffold998_cov411-Prasinococcus_capsulatus_cf.AAC.11